jgi:hypothetical protein
MTIGQDDGLLQLVNRQIYVPYRAYTSRNNFHIHLQVILVQLQIGSPGIPEEYSIDVMLPI